MGERPFFFPGAVVLKRAFPDFPEEASLEEGRLEGFSIIPGESRPLNFVLAILAELRGSLMG